MAEAKDILNEFSELIINDIQARFEVRGANATKKTIRSLVQQSTDESTVIRGGGGFIDSGAEQGSPAKTLVPLSDLIEWCQARGIPIHKAGRIQRNIFRHGTSSVSKEHPRELFTEIINDKVRREEMYSRLQSALIRTASSEIVQQFKR